MTHSTPEGESASPPHYPSNIFPEHWQAYRRLQRYCREAKDPFIRDANEYALSRMAEEPNRKAKGERLAHDLFRDGKRVVQRRNERFANNLDERQSTLDDLAFSTRSHVWKEDVVRAIGVVRVAFRRLSRRKRTVLRLDVQDDVRVAEIRGRLGIGPRQLRNIAREARDELWAKPEVVSAYQTLIQHLDAEGQRMVERLVTEVLLREGAA